MTTTEPKGAGIEKYAEKLRTELAAFKQQELFRAAVEAGFLTALADGEHTAAERAALVQSLHALSSGAVIEWEIETLLAELAEGIEKEGATKRAETVGEKLKALGQVETGLVVAALVALASKGLDKREAVVLERFGTAAGLSRSEVGAIVKKARAL